ncbi:MAG: CPBP family intramembrane metalloprotease [Prevotella sp.]|nr:CPBP family intramembrane metalloprotease [Prevotella sp.]
MKKFLNVLAYLFVFLGIQAAAGLFFGKITPMITGNTDITVSGLIYAQAAAGILTLAIFYLARWVMPERAYLRTHPYGVLLWSAVAAVGMIIPSQWVLEHLPELPNIAEQEFGMLLNTPQGYIVIGLFAPVVEEVVFRGAILRTLLNGGNRHWAMIAISALIFSVAHFNPAQLPYTFVVGLLLGWLYYRSGSILPGMVYHWVNNSVAFAMAIITKNPDAKLADLFGGNDTRVLMAVAFSLMILVPALLQLNLWLRKPTE